jgi:hypothetical protein
MAIRIPIISEFSDKGIKQAQYEFNKLDSNVQKAGYVLNKAILPAAAAFGTLTQVIGPAVTAASNMQESMSKVGVIFGAGAKEVEAFAQSAARNLGQSKQAVLDAAGVFGTFGKAAGLAGEDLALFSNDFTTLATDLASFNNTTPEEAVQAIGAALRGEAEPLRRFGVLLDDATLKAEAMKLGIYDGSGALTAQQKILAAQAAIYKQTSDAQGDFARTADGLANKQRTLSALIDNYQAQLGQQLLPKVNELVDLTLEAESAFANLPDPVKNSAGAFGDLLDKVNKLINPLASTLDIVKRIFGFFSDEQTFGAYNENLGVSAAQQMRVADAAGIERRAIQQSNEVKGKGTKATKELTQANKDLENQIAKARTEIEQRLNSALSDAQSRLDAANNAYGSFGASIKNSITGTLSFTDALKEAVDAKGTFIGGLTVMANRSKLFGERVSTLLKMGLSESALQKVLDAGVEAGTFIADELINGGADAIRQTNELVQALENVANKLGKDAAEEFYGAGVAQGEAMVAGIKAVLDDFMARLDSDKLTLPEIKAIGASADAALSAATNAPSVPMAPTFGEGYWAGLPGGDVNITVNGVLSNAQTGETIINAMRAYNRSAGPARIEVSGYV